MAKSPWHEGRCETWGLLLPSKEQSIQLRAQTRPTAVPPPRWAPKKGGMGMGACGTLMGRSTSTAPSGTLALCGSKRTSNVSVSQ